METAKIMDEPRTLQELVDLAMSRHKATRGAELARLAQDNGHRIVATTINAIRRGTYRSTPERPTLEAIAFLAGVPIRVAYHAAQLKAPGRPFAEELPADVDLLDEDERDVIKRFITLCLRRHRAQRPTGYRDVGNEEGTYSLVEECLPVTDGNGQ